MLYCSGILCSKRFLRELWIKFFWRAFPGEALLESVSWRSFPGEGWTKFFWRAFSEERFLKNCQIAFWKASPGQFLEKFSWKALFRVLRCIFPKKRYWAWLVLERISAGEPLLFSSRILTVVFAVFHFLPIFPFSYPDTPQLLVCMGVSSIVNYPERVSSETAGGLPTLLLIIYK